jgi:hypothetical protein
MKNDQFDVELVNQVKLANSVVGDHGIGQFQEMANPVQQTEYIARRIADYARRRRNARAKGRMIDQNNSNDISGHGKKLTQTPPIFYASNVPPSIHNINHPELPSVPEIGHNRELKRQPSDTDIDRPVPTRKRIATLLGPSRKIDYRKPNPFYYTLVGESYVHSMMNGEAISFRSRYSARKSIQDRILPQTFELR